MKNNRYTLRAMARLLAYPDADLRASLDELMAAIDAEAALAAPRRAELRALARVLANGDPIEVEARYVETFDRGRSTSLHLFEHVHGDSRDRGPAMIDLTQTYEKAGLALSPDELPTISVSCWSLPRRSRRPSPRHSSAKSRISSTPSSTPCSSAAVRTRR